MSKYRRNEKELVIDTNLVIDYRENGIEEDYYKFETEGNKSKINYSNRYTYYDLSSISSKRDWNPLCDDDIVN